MFMPDLEILVYLLSYNIIQTKFHSERLLVCKVFLMKVIIIMFVFAIVKKWCRSNVCSCKKKSLNCTTRCHSSKPCFNRIV